MREIVTTLLDAAGLLLLAAGMGVQVDGWLTMALDSSTGLGTALGGVGLSVAGLVVIGGAWLAGRPADQVAP